MTSVLHLCRRFFPQTNGSEIYTGALISLLSNRGVRNFILAAGSPDDRYLWHDVPVSRADDHSVLAHTGRTGFYDQFVSLLGEHKPDVVHWHFLPVEAEQLLQASIGSGCRNVHTLHHPVTLCARHDLLRFGKSVCEVVPNRTNCGPCMAHQRGLPASLSAAFTAVARSIPLRIKQALPQSRVKTSLTLADDIGDWVESQQRALCGFDAHVVLSNASAAVLARSGVDARKITVSRLGTHHSPPNKPPWVSWTNPPRPVRIIFVGRLDRVKGVVTLVQAANHFSSRELRLDVYGLTGDADADIQNLLRQPDCPTQFCGFLALDDVVNRMSQYDFVAIPSQFFETGPFTAVEALQAGTPLIASDMPSLNEFVDHGRTGWLVAPGSVPAWRRALRTAIDDPLLAASMRQRASFPRSMDDVASEMTAIYQRFVPSTAPDQSTP